MRRLVTLAMALSLVGGAFVVDAAAESKKRTSRTETETYFAPTLAQYPACVPGLLGLGCQAFEVMAEDRYLSVSVWDQLGYDVRGSVNEDVDGGLYAEIVTPFCGSTEEPIKLDPETVHVTISIMQGPCADGTFALASFGRITVRFTNHLPR